MVGAYWVEVTGGQGRYFRSDRERLLYGQDWVHGEVRTDDAVLREKLKDVLGFLAVRRALVRLTSEPDGEYFGMRERKSRVSHSSVEGGKNAVPNGEGAWTNVLEISVRNP
jgi:hypothetical protein